jgi:LytS/YehU family sensor histidine kinase
LKIERERFEERLAFNLDLPNHLVHVPVPSLIVQPLVENAVKQGIAGLGMAERSPCRRPWNTSCASWCGIPERR